VIAFYIRIVHLYEQYKANYAKGKIWCSLFEFEHSTNSNHIAQNLRSQYFESNYFDLNPKIQNLQRSFTFAYITFMFSSVSIAVFC
jgi:hypothetical protein